MSTSQITIVAWTWAFDTPTPSGTVVHICETVTGVTTCLDVSQLPQGQTTFFQNTPALNLVFFITFKVPGTGGIVETLKTLAKFLLITTFKLL
jgi:hypothetical protein